MTNYPNLELLEYKAWLIVKKENPDMKWINFDAYVFPQTWGSTALGFDGEIGGQAMTKAYTTVFYCNNTKEYYVFFEERFAYRVENPTPAFLQDLDDRHMSSVSKAKNKY